LGDEPGPPPRGKLGGMMLTGKLQRCLFWGTGAKEKDGIKGRKKKKLGGPEKGTAPDPPLEKEGVNVAFWGRGVEQGGAPFPRKRAQEPTRGGNDS